MAKKQSIRELATLERNHGHVDMSVKMLLGNEYLIQANITDTSGEQYQVEVVAKNRSQLKRMFDEITSIAFDATIESQFGGLDGDDEEDDGGNE